MSDIDPNKLKIIYYPDKILRTKCNPITVFDDQLKQIAQRMILLMHEHQGVGLSAPQVGLSIRLFVVNKLALNSDKDLIVINPKLENMKHQTESKEGCLSIPNIQANIKRAKYSNLLAQDIYGNEFKTETQDLFSYICQHEIDHLNGILIIDKMSPADKIRNKKYLKVYNGK